MPSCSPRSSREGGDRPVVFDIVRLIGYGVVLLGLAYPLGLYMAKVFAGEKTWLLPFLSPGERVVYRVAGVDPNTEMPWTVYAASLLLFNFACFTVLYLMLRFQGVLPLNPTQAPGMVPDVAFNTAVSFVTNTNWQAYAGETGASHLIQMAGFTWQNFISAATGISIAVALIRGLTRKEVRTIGNFWVDLTRAWMYVLVPISIVLALVYVSQGVPQTLAGVVNAKTVQGAAQAIHLGPVASQEAIKELGTNGGGFFNANSAHPFENPSPLPDFLQILAIFLIPAALCYTFGSMVGDTR